MWICDKAGSRCSSNCPHQENHLRRMTCGDTTCGSDHGKVTCIEVVELPLKILISKSTPKATRRYLRTKNNVDL